MQRPPCSLQCRRVSALRQLPLVGFRLRASAVQKRPVISSSHLTAFGAETCEPSYPRKSAARTSDPAARLDVQGTPAGPPHVQHSCTTEPRHSQGDDTSTTRRTPPLPPGTASSLFFGESNLLTCVPRQNTPSHSGQANLSYPGMFSTPGGALPYEGSQSGRTEDYLRDAGALAVPDLRNSLPALRAYFTWFHPCFPIVDRADIAAKLLTNDISPLLLQAILLVACTYCDDSVISSMGFTCRFHAKSSFYNRARLLFDADWDKDQLTVLQSLFLMSFWRGGPSNMRDVRYWLGVTIALAQTFGLHRSTRFTTRDTRTAGLRKRLWWSIYVRERQAAASLGLPSRIRDEDCDIEMLTHADFGHDTEPNPHTSFGAPHIDHVVYAIKLVEIARLLGRIIDTHFVPGRMPSTREDAQQLKDALEQWKASLPDGMRNVPDPEGSSVWVYLIHLAYKSDACCLCQSC